MRSCRLILPLTRAPCPCLCLHLSRRRVHGLRRGQVRSDSRRVRVHELQQRNIFGSHRSSFKRHVHELPCWQVLWRRCVRGSPCAMHQLCDSLRTARKRESMRARKSERERETARTLRVRERERACERQCERMSHLWTARVRGKGESSASERKGTETERAHAALGPSRSCRLILLLTRAPRPCLCLHLSRL